MRYYSSKQTYKNQHNKKIAGVCAGLAERLELPVWVTRVLTIFVALSFPIFTGIAYLIASISLPSKPRY